MSVQHCVARFQLLDKSDEPFVFNHAHRKQTLGEEHHDVRVDEFGSLWATGNLHHSIGR